MKNKTLKLALSLSLAGLMGSAQAALMDRGGGLIYDTDLNVTWLQNANINGAMTWAAATTWAANLSYYDSVRAVTYTDWRLPTTTDTGVSGCQYAYNGTDCGFNVDPASSEMAHLYFTELGNLSHWTTTGGNSGAYGGGANSGSTLDNVGFFTNFQSSNYWSGTEYAPDTGSAWIFDTQYGRQYYDNKTGTYSLYYALAVRPGDVADPVQGDGPAAVPEPATLLLLGLGLAGLGVMRRRG